MRSGQRKVRRPNFPRNFSIELEKRGGTAWSSLPFKKLVLITLLVNLLMGISTIIIQKNLPPEVPLYFGLPQGVSQLSSSIHLIIPVSISLSITIINGTLTLFISNEYLKKALVLTSAGLTF